MSIRVSALLLFVGILFNQLSFGQNALPKTGDSIQITQLKEVIISLQSKKSFKGFSLSSSAEDNISLNYEGKKFEIVYRPEKESYDLWVPKFQDFAMMGGREIKIVETTDERKSRNGKSLSSTAITMKEKDRDAVYELIRGMMLSIFKNKKNAYYQLV